jgi:hypothetical protein
MSGQAITLDNTGIMHPDWHLQLDVALASRTQGGKLRLVQQHWRVLFDQAALLENPIATIVERHYRVALPKHHEDLQIVETVSIDQVHNHVNLHVRVHNPNRASHPDGQWDLGDEQSVWLSEFGYRCTPQSQQAPQLHIGKCAMALDVGIKQTSSGGVHWDSVAHVNADNRIELKQVKHQPPRPTPALSLAGESQWQVIMAHFWEKFPSAIYQEPQSTAQSAPIRLSFALPELSSHQELQPGERWSRQLAIHSAPILEGVSVLVDPDYLAQTHCIERFDPQLASSPWFELLLQTQQWEAKREQIDLFGFRHFGELFADHESSQLPPNEYLVSVYNNQYDPLAGLLKVYLSTGDERYWQLADALAQHILDIDIYHTVHDKPEYSGGLFWHTDHYVPAQTSTHRTYSKLQPRDVYMDHAGGGGPGGQHCYTEGLTLYYFITGDTAAKDAVSQLQSWITCIYEGDNTLFGLLLAYKNRHRHDLKNIITGQYPFDRGTANYVNACLDRFAISSDSQYLTQAIRVIEYTCSPTDDIVTRQLDDIENTWFYVVMLQAVARCHRILTQMCSNDKSGQPASYSEALTYCRATLLHYGQYLLAHACLSLEHADQLEYPNETWTAQDLRKVDVLRYVASIAAPDAQQQYIIRADALASAIFKRLSASEERKYTRVQALLMQNWPVSYADDTPQDMTMTPAISSAKSTRSLDFLSEWSIQIEIENLKKRSQTLAQWIP